MGRFYGDYKDNPDAGRNNADCFLSPTIGSCVIIVHPGGYHEYSPKLQVLLLREVLFLLLLLPQSVTPCFYQVLFSERMWSKEPA